MDDPNMMDFYGRVARIEKARSQGLGFEAPGTLGRSYYYQNKGRRRSVLGPILFLSVSALLLKGTIYHQIGPESYNARVALLQQGDSVERIGGWLMQEEAATIFVSDRIAWALAKFM